MPQLIIEQPGLQPMTVELHEPVTRCGRAEENEVVLVAEEVSRYHAKIRLDGPKTVLEDLKSLNGTYVNRQRIVERILSDNDEVWFGGKCRAIFKEDSAAILEERAKRAEDSGLAKDLQEIKAEMENVSASMTMMGQAGQGGDKTMVVAPGAEAGEVQVEKMARAFRRLDAVYKASTLLASDFDLQKRMTQIIDLAIEVMGADRGFVMLRKEDTDDLGASVARGMGQELAPSMGIARRAAIEGEPVLMADSGADGTFGARESIIRQRITSAMCVPLRVEDRILGALYVDSKNSGIQFSEEDLELFQALASQSAMAIENVRLYERMVEAEKKRTNLGRFLSPAVVEHIMNDETDLELGGQARDVTTMFCDIRSFTPMAENMSPDVLVGLLNEHFTALTDIVFQYQGTLDKYVGDEVMALFGAPFSTTNDAQLAIQAALAMQAKNDELNEKRKQAGLPEFQMGIGINTGEVIAGYIGSPKRMDFTVLGDHVNVASRLCSVAQGGQVVIGEPTYERIKDFIEVESLGTPVLKGKATSMHAYSVLSLKAQVQQQGV